MDGSVWVILPTYNEAENIEAVVGGIRAAAPEVRILVVDDNSRDGTGELADRLADDVLHRPGKRASDALTRRASPARSATARGTSARWTRTSRTTRRTCRG